MRGIVLACVLLLAALPLQANTPEELVRWIYQTEISRNGGPQGIAYLTAPENRRGFLSTRFADFYDASDSYGNDLLMSCIDFGPAIPGQDFEPQEIANTLQVTSDQTDARWHVTADFRTAGLPAKVEYIFLPVDGIWKLDDIIRDGRAMSNIPCVPKGDSTPQLRGTGYCYLDGGTSLVLDIGGTGAGQFEISSWQDNGHGCFAKGQLRPVAGGWYADGVSGDRQCKISLSVRSDNAIQVSAQGCVTMCGARAHLDGLVLPAQSQRRCVNMPG